jgi:hypothetical protein
VAFENGRVLMDRTSERQNAPDKQIGCCSPSDDKNNSDDVRYIATLENLESLRMVQYRVSDSFSSGHRCDGA